MINVYSPFGIPSDFFVDIPSKKILLIFDPDINFFSKENLYNIRSQYDYLILFDGCEPPLINNMENNIIENINLFDKIYTINKNIYEKYENTYQFVFGSCWVLTNVEGLDCKFQKNYNNQFSTDKKYMISFIKSTKNFLPGHKLRHDIMDIISKKREWTLFFPNNIPINEKKILFQESMFHLCIENSRYNNYITEKLIDCFMSYTVPIYWGAPNVSEHFNQKGIITFEDKKSLNDVLDKITEYDFYDRLPYILENYDIAFKKYAFFFDRINEIILNL